MIRQDLEVPAADPAGGYDSKQDELIARAPIRKADGTFAPDYLADRVRVWELMSELTRSHDCWSYVRPAQRTRDGRLAFLGLRGHYLGANNVDNMSAQAERKLQTTTYTGEKRRWNFEKYVKVMIDQHAVLKGLTEHGYAGIDDRSKVRHLLAGIKTNALDSVKTQIMSNAVLRSDFDACVNLFQDFLTQTANQQTTREVTISAFHAEGGGGGGDGGGETEADLTVKDRYYTKAEYDKLTPAEKVGLKLKRKKRGHVPGSRNGKGGSGGGTGGGKSKVDLSARTIKALVSAVTKSQEETASDTEDESESDEEPPMKKPRKNRDNKALQRTGKSKK